MPCSRARQQLIGGLNDSDLTAINVRERGWINVCVVSLRRSIHRLNTRLQCPVCSLFSFHADTWTADASDKKSLYSSASICSPPLSLFHSGHVGICYMKVGWIFQMSLSQSLCSLSTSASSCYLTPLPSCHFFFFSASVVCSQLKSITTWQQLESLCRVFEAGYITIWAVATSHRWALTCRRLNETYCYVMIRSHPPVYCSCVRKPRWSRVGVCSRVFIVSVKAATQNSADCF